MVEELEEFLDTGFNRGELKHIFFPENPVICRSCHKPRINIVPNNAKNNGQNNPQNIVHNNAQFEIHDIGPNFNQGANANIQNHLPNAQNYVTRDEFDELKNEFAEFKESINGRFDRLERSIQALGGRNVNNEERKRKKEKKTKMK